jgi:hypothetical protein
MTHKEFYIWLDGFMSNRSWTVIQEVDIELIQEKMKEVKDEFDFDKFINISKRRKFNEPIVVDSKEQLND